MRPTDRVTPQRGLLRLARALCATLGSVAAAGVAHRTSGGVVPVDVVLPLTAGAFGVAWLLAGRRLTAGQLLGLVLLTQVVVHLTAAHGDTAMGSSMLLAHVAAAGATTVVLARGEWCLWALARRLVLRPLQLTAVAVPRVSSSLTSTDRVLVDALASARVRVRGPPVTC